jgi:hypothetical protein
MHVLTNGCWRALILANLPQPDWRPSFPSFRHERRPRPAVAKYCQDPPQKSTSRRFGPVGFRAGWDKTSHAPPLSRTRIPSRRVRDGPTLDRLQVLERGLRGNPRQEWQTRPAAVGVHCTSTCRSGVPAYAAVSSTAAIACKGRQQDHYLTTLYCVYGGRQSLHLPLGLRATLSNLRGLTGELGVVFRATVIWNFFQSPSLSCLIWTEARPTFCNPSFCPVRSCVVWMAQVGTVGHFQRTGCSVDSVSSKARVRRNQRRLQGSNPPRGAGLKVCTRYRYKPSSPAATCRGP